MHTYKFEITETLQRTIIINAADEKEAYKIIRNKYKEQEIILDSSDFIESTINMIK